MSIVSGLIEKSSRSLHNEGLSRIKRAGDADPRFGNQISRNWNSGQFGDRRSTMLKNFFGSWKDINKAVVGEIGINWNRGERWEAVQNG